MVVSGEPEDRNRVHACRGCLGCKLDRGEGFVNVEHGPAEKSDLLSGHDCGGAAAQAVEIGQRFGRGVPGFVLAFEDVSDAFAAGGIVGQFGRFLFHPLKKARGSGVERLYLG